MPMVALFPVCGFYTSTTPDVRSKSIVFTRRWRFLCPTCGFYIYTISDRAETVMAYMPIVLVISDMWFLYAHGCYHRRRRSSSSSNSSLSSSSNKSQVVE